MSIISRFPGGGGADDSFKVIVAGSYAALPSSVANNTIGLITSVAVGAISLSHTAPSSPVNGDVWIMTSVTGSRLLPIGKNYIAATYLVRCYQLVSGVWVEKDMYIYQSASWQSMYTYLYSRGTEFVTVHGMGTMLSDTPSMIAKGANYFDAIVSATANNWKGCWWEAIDYSPYVTLRLIISTPAATLSVGYADSSHILTTLGTGLSEAQVDINVSALNSTVKLWIGRATAAADTFRVFEAYLI